ncbi:MAG: ATP-binding protein [Oculatellaceae cyanobacterium Prado106]|jgi:signal transduction histidine kinase|nr:ATP-binding protein [Oculatellaceae cyanobacterium Prado106]
MLCIHELLTLELFQKLPEERLQWVCDRAQEIRLPAGATLVEEGAASRGFLVVTEGVLAMTRRSEGIEMPIGQHAAPAFFGEINVLTDEPVAVTVRALNDCRLHEINADDFRQLLHECRDFERTVFQTVAKRLRGLESFIRGREKMAALGTLSAGLAHELNNPASAIVRSLKDVVPALAELQRMNLIYGQQNVDEAHTQEWLKVRDQGYETIVNQSLGALEQSDREDELLDWLEDYGVQDAWKLAPPLAMAGVEAATLERLVDRWRNYTTELRDMGIRWLALSFDVMSLIHSGQRAAERIGELVRSMKSYSHLDQGVQQTIDVHDGLEDTLRIFSYRLKQGIEVQREYDRQLPHISAYGSELNQVWTNLIDNAIDAMNGKGILTLATKRDGDHICVKITDSGSGMSPEIQSRIFEPFYTTKPVGQGSGLGLDIVRRIVENRHRGAIAVNSQPGKTTFVIRLPIA